MSEGKIAFPGAKPPEIPEDAKSLGEAMGMATGVDLASREQLNKFNKLLREDGVEKHVNRVIIFGIWAVSIAALAMFGVIVAHKIKPDIWLTTAQLTDLQSFLFSGGVGAAITAAGKRIIKPDKNA
jgi:hypothetical protein